MRLGGPRIPDPAGATRRAPADPGRAVGKVSVGRDGLSSQLGAKRRPAGSSTMLRPARPFARAIPSSCPILRPGFSSPTCALACGPHCGAICATSARPDCWTAVPLRLVAQPPRGQALSPPDMRGRKRLRRSAIRRTHGDDSIRINDNEDRRGDFKAIVIEKAESGQKRRAQGFRRSQPDGGRRRHPCRVVDRQLQGRACGHRQGAGGAALADDRRHRPRRHGGEVVASGLEAGRQGDPQRLGPRRNPSRRLRARRRG